MAPAIGALEVDKAVEVAQPPHRAITFGAQGLRITMKVRCQSSRSLMLIRPTRRNPSATASVIICAHLTLQRALMELLAAQGCCHRCALEQFYLLGPPDHKTLTCMCT